MDLTSLGKGQDAGPIPMTTGVGVMCSPGEGCAGPESTTAQYVAYNETTVHTYLCMFISKPCLGTFKSTSSLTPKGLLFMRRTLFPSMARFVLPRMNKNRNCVYTTPLLIFSN
jgi:hypothetical protein